MSFDFIDWQTELTEEQRSWYEKTSAVCKEHIDPNLAEAFESAEFDEKIIRVLGEAELIGPHVWRHSGQPIDALASGMIMRRLEMSDSSYRSFASVQGSLVMYPIEKYGSDQQKATWLPKLAKGEAVGGFALTEPQGGSDPANMQTTLKRKGNKLILNGHKRWVTNAPFADVIVVWAKTEEGIQAVLCPTSLEGINIKVLSRKLSLRISKSAEISFDEVEIAEDMLLPKAKGLGRALDCLNQARYGIVWGATGAAEASLNETIDYAKERKLFDKPLAGFQMVQAKLADACLKLSESQLLALHIGKLKIKGDIKPQHISLGKQSSVQKALEITRSCREILGGNGILLDYATMRHMVNLETVFTYEGTHDIHRLIVGAQITGLNAFS